MTTIALIGGVTYPHGNVPNSATLGNIPIQNSSISPEAMVLFYGFRDAIEGMSAWQQQAEKSGNGFIGVEVTFDAGDAETRATEENLKDLRVLQFRHMSEEIEALIIDKWQTYVAEKGISISNGYYRRHNYVKKNPELLSRLRQEPEFSHLDVIIFPVTEGRLTKYRAMLFSKDHVLKVEAKNTREDININLPALTAKKRLKPN